MSRKTPSRRSNARSLLTAGAVIAAFVALGWALAIRVASPLTIEQPATPHFVDTTQPGDHAAGSGRTVIVARLGEAIPGISGETGPLMTTLVRGTFPEGARLATVRTDENCAPDQDGVSHCLNELDFGATQVVVQHHHAMAKTPCLTPGETVRVLTVEQFYAQS